MTIHNITTEVLSHKYFLQYIYSNMDLHYYWSNDFSETFYIDLVQAGFINTSIESEGVLLLLGEIQKANAVLLFDDLHISKKVKQLKRKVNYRLSFNTVFEEVMTNIQNSYDDCWMVGKYADLMKRLHSMHDNRFTLISCELFDEYSNQLIAGEIGYITANKVYTSLTGFHSHDSAYNNWGTLQMVLLAEHLKEEGMRFWNLGHPYMQYKIDLGAKVISRSDFIKLWFDGYNI